MSLTLAPTGRDAHPAPGAPLGRRARWLGARARWLHLALLIAFPGCLYAGWWQLHRALSGNTLSYLYTFEWPLFAVLSVWGWWQLLHAPVGSELDVDGRAADLPRWSPEEESPELRRYNELLDQLAANERRSRALPAGPRPPRALPPAATEP